MTFHNVNSGLQIARQTFRAVLVFVPFLLQLTDTGFCCFGAGKGVAVVDAALLDILEHLRAHFGRSIKVNSGFRCSWRNAAVGGASKSKHLHGMAADIVISGVSPDDVYAYLDKGYNGGRGWQGGLGRYRTFTHIDTRAYEQRF